MGIFVYAIKLLIAGLLIQAGASKLRSQHQRYYGDVIHGYGVPQGLASSMPRLIGLGELLIAVFVLIPQFTQSALFAAAGLLALYLVAVAKQLIQGQVDANCGCAGPGADVKISPLLLLRNALLIGLCLFSASVVSSSFASTWFIVVPLAASLGLIYQSCEQMIVNQQKIEMLYNT